MNRNSIITSTEEFVRSRMENYDSGHDWWHIERVRKTARYINEQELLADPFTLDIAALLHDTVDSKFAEGKIEKGYSEISEFLTGTGMSELKDRVIEIISNVSFSKGASSVNINDPVLQVLQDADRLDAIGAIGIARAFNYGGFRNNPIYIPDEKSLGKSKSTIGHFYDKLLKLKDMMNTATGRKMAEERHAILEQFLDQFYIEWEFGG